MRATGYASTRLFQAGSTLTILESKSLVIGTDPTVHFDDNTRATFRVTRVSVQGAILQSAAGAWL
jgi:hypothetical protein